jgi:hypothetical protein
MHTDHAPKEMPTGCANYPAGHRDNTLVPNLPDAEKAFATLIARFALAGHALNRTDLANGPVSHYAECWYSLRYLSSLDDALRFLAQIG